MTIAMIGSRGLLVRHSGLETHVRELATHLALLGQHVVVYGRRDTKLPPMPDCRTEVESKDVFCLQGKFTATVSSTMCATLDALISKRFDVLHFHGVGCVFAMMVARACRAPIVLSLHSTNWQEKKWSWFSRILIHALERLAVRNADSVIVVSEALASRIRVEYGVPAHVIPNGARIMGQPEQDDEILGSHGLEKGRFVLFVGRLVPDKGCHVIVDALREANIPLKLVLAGPHQDPTYAKSLLANATDNVYAPGLLGEPELGALYRSCRVFCSASLSEGQPVVLLEALAHGATCLVSDIPGHRELVTDPDMRFRVNDSSELAAKLAALCSSEKCAGVAPCWLENNPQHSFAHAAARAIEAYGQNKT